MMSALAAVAIAGQETAPPAPVQTTAGPAIETRVVPRNAVIGTAAFPIPDYGVSVSYLRGLGRRYSVSAALEYTSPRNGYGHLVGLSQTLGGQIWITRPLHGVWGGVSLTLAETFLSKAPVLRRVAVAGGVNAGFLWQFRFGLLLGASGALRFARSAGGSELVCSRAGSCPATRSGIYTRVGLDVGWAF
jgi:hypothetical protein